MKGKCLIKVQKFLNIKNIEVHNGCKGVEI